MIALIDGDIVRYRTGFASNTVNEAIACSRANETMEQILRATDAGEFRVFLSDSLKNNFRYHLTPTYKSSREHQPKPIHHEALGLFLKQEWGAVVTYGEEADDALGIHQAPNTIICSIDKDLLQVPGNHYNWVRNEWREVTEYEGIRSFYEQCLTGDRTDDVSGLQGIGPVKARRALEGCRTEAEHFEVVRKMWNNDEALLMTGRLLWVRRKQGELWQFPVCITPDTTALSLSLNTKHEENDQYSEHGTQEKSGHQQHGYPEGDMTPTSFEP